MRTPKKLYGISHSIIAKAIHIIYGRKAIKESIKRKGKIEKGFFKITVVSTDTEDSTEFMNMSDALETMKKEGMIEEFDDNAVEDGFVISYIATGGESYKIRAEEILSRLKELVASLTVKDIQ